jgi:mRNA-degrading endonuclease RelE of RelBE toxin-antitoxin system
MKIYYSKTSLKYLQKLEQSLSHKIVESIDKLPDEGDIAKLKGKKVKNLYRLRIGKHRVLFIIEKESIKVVKIDTRGDVYK